MKLSMEIKPDMGRLMKRLGENINGGRKAGMIYLLATVEAASVKGAPVKTSNLVRTRTAEVKDNGDKGILKFTAPYAGYVHEGTGLYGPHKTKIVAKNKQALYWPGATHPCRAVKGMHGRPWVKKAAASINMAETYKDGMNNYLNQHGGQI